MIYPISNADRDKLEQEARDLYHKIRRAVQLANPTLTGTRTDIEASKLFRSIAVEQGEICAMRCVVAERKSK